MPHSLAGAHKALSNRGPGRGVPDRRDRDRTRCRGGFAEPAGPVVVDSVGLAPHPRLGIEGLRKRLEAEPSQDADRTRLEVAGEVLVQHQDGRTPQCSKKASQDASSWRMLVEQMGDGPVWNRSCGRWSWMKLLYGGARSSSRPTEALWIASCSRQVAVCTAFHRDTAWRILLAHHPDERHLWKDGWHQVLKRHVPVTRDVSQEAHEVLEVAPHELRAEHSVVGGAGLHRPVQITVVGRPTPERRPRLRVIADGSLAEVIENGLDRPYRRSTPRGVAAATVAQGLEVLLGTPRNTRALSAWQTSVLPLLGVAHTR